MEAVIIAIIKGLKIVKVLVGTTHAALIEK